MYNTLRGLTCLWCWFIKTDTANVFILWISYPYYCCFYTNLVYNSSKLNNLLRFNKLLFFLMFSSRQFKHISTYLLLLAYFVMYSPVSNVFSMRENPGGGRSPRLLIAISANTLFNLPWNYIILKICYKVVCIKRLKGLIHKCQYFYEYMYNVF